MLRRTAIMVGPVTVLAWACASEAGGPRTEAPGAGPAPRSASLDDAVRAARADAARRTGLAPGVLEVVSAESVTWSDGSLGCPQAGMVYTQALVPGYRVRISAAGQEFDYHASRRGPVSLCPAGRAVEPSPDDGRR